MSSLFFPSFLLPDKKKFPKKNKKKRRISRFIRLYSPICCHRKYREENLSTVYIFSSFQSSHHSHFFNHLFFFSFDLFLLADHIKSFTCGKLYYRTSYLDAKRDVLYVGAMWVIYSVIFFFISFWFISILSTRAILIFFGCASYAVHNTSRIVEKDLTSQMLYKTVISGVDAAICDASRPSCWLGFSLLSAYQCRFFFFFNLEILSPFLSKLSSSFSVQTNRRSKKKKRTKRKKIVFFFDWTGSAIQTRTETECGTTTWATTNISRCFRAFLVCFCLFLFYSYYNVKMRETIIFVFFFFFSFVAVVVVFEIVCRDEERTT